MKKLFSIIIAAFFLTATAAHATSNDKGLLITHKDGANTFLLLNREIEMTWTDDQTLHISNKRNIDYDMNIFDMEEFVISMQPTGTFATVTDDGLMLICQVLSEEGQTMLIGSKSSVPTGAIIGAYTIPETVLGYHIVGVMDKAFANCIDLSNLTIPSYVTSVGNGVLAGCDGLVELTVDKENSIYDSRDNCQAIIETASNTLVAGCSKTVIPKSVTVIGTSAFEGCNNLTSVEIPVSVATIESAAFKNCSGLTSVTIGNSVTSIGTKAFSGCI